MTGGVVSVRTGRVKQSRPMPLAVFDPVARSGTGVARVDDRASTGGVPRKSELDYAISNGAAHDGNSGVEDREVNLGAGFKCHRVGSIAQDGCGSNHDLPRSERHRPDWANRC